MSISSNKDNNEYNGITTVQVIGKDLALIILSSLLNLKNI